MSAGLRFKLIESRHLVYRQQTSRVEAGCSLGASLSGIGADLLLLSGQARERYINSLSLEPGNISAARHLHRRLGEAINSYEAASSVELPADVERGE